MKDHQVEQMLQQLRETISRRDAAASMADTIERVLKLNGIEFKLGMVGTTWKRVPATAGEARGD